MTARACYEPGHSLSGTAPDPAVKSSSPSFCQTRYSRSVRDLVRKSPKFFGVVLLTGLGLRLLFLLVFAQVTDDSRIYADIALNWLHHGIYGITTPGGIAPTYIRLPGYPAFLALVFALFGDSSFRTVMLCQIAFDLGTCFLIADLARRMAGTRAAKVSFLLAALCPFLANYSAAVLTETLEVFFTALAVDLAVLGLECLPAPRFRAWAGSGLAIAACIYIRPDGGLLLPAIALYLLLQLIRCRASASKDVASNIATGSLVLAGLIVLLCSLAPLIPWTLRNSRTMHRFEPLTPRYANEPGEFVPAGFNRWVKTWIADYASVEEIYWQEPGAKIDVSRLPMRAFDSSEQKVKTQDILNRYNDTTDIGPDLDHEFESLASERIHGHWFRYYVWLPALRITDMWLRPRTELLPADSRWWEFNDDARGIILSVSFGSIGLLYIMLAIESIWRVRPIRWLGLLVLFLIIRSLFLGTLENPEPRYTLECYAAVIALAGTALARLAQLDSRSY